MNLLGRNAQLLLTGWAHKLALDVLFARTAAAFGTAAPSLSGLSARQTLDAYAAFTARAAAASSASRDGPAVESRLFKTAQSTGVWLRRLLGVSSMNDAMAAARICYWMLDIDFEGDAHGNVCITRCLFAGAYSPAACQVMSALDAGLLAGLTGGGQLVFSERLTEGFRSCRARVFAEAKA